MAENNNRRYPPNLRGLLNFCTEYTKSEDAPSAGDPPVMSEEVVDTLQNIHGQSKKTKTLIN